MPTYLIENTQKGYAIRERMIRVTAETYEEATSKIWNDADDIVIESEDFWFDELKEDEDRLESEI